MTMVSSGIISIFTAMDTLPWLMIRGQVVPQCLRYGLEPRMDDHRKFNYMGWSIGVTKESKWLPFLL